MNLRYRHAVALPLALAIAACGNGAAQPEPPASGEPVAQVAPPAGQSWSTTAQRTADGGWLVGNPEAPIRLVEYGSLTCPACASFAANGSQPLMEDYIDSGRVSFELRSAIIHGMTDLVLTALVACGQPEAAVPRADAVWANLDPVLDAVQQNAAQIEQRMSLPEDQRFVAFGELSGLIEFFAGLGLNQDQARQCLADAGEMQRIAQQSQSTMERDSVTGTPTFFLNGQRIDGIQWSDVEPVLQRAGAR